MTMSDFLSFLLAVGLVLAIVLWNKYIAVATVCLYIFIVLLEFFRDIK